MKTRARRHGLTPVERAVLVSQWRSEGVTARIHALIGDDAQALVGGAGKVLYVVLGAAAAAGLSPDEPDLRIVRGAVNAVYDQAEVAEIPEDRRASIVSGLQACERLLPRFTQRALADAALDLRLKLLRQDVHYSDFAALLERGKP